MRETVTTLLDVLGLLLLVSAASYGVFLLVGLVAALSVAGVSLIGGSALISYLGREK